MDVLELVDRAVLETVGVITLWVQVPPSVFYRKECLFFLRKVFYKVKNINIYFINKEGYIINNKNVPSLKKVDIYIYECHIKNEYNLI